MSPGTGCARTACALAMMCVTTLLACGGDDPSANSAASDVTGADLPLAVHAQLDSAAAAYRDGNFRAARAHYRMAADTAPDLAASWFGLFLAERSLGNMAAADSALREARRLSADTLSTQRPNPR
ncbi:MAG: hypothetical protein ACREL7_11295 [Longimicrobiales bacterium]